MNLDTKQPPEYINLTLAETFNSNVLRIGIFYVLSVGLAFYAQPYEGQSTIKKLKNLKY